MSLEHLSTALAGRYRIERELGAGGMATVYLAADLKHHRQVAIKVMHEELSAAIGGERFLREITTIARLQHPHILPLIDSDRAGGMLYYVAPYVRGETLRELLTREGRLAPDRAAALALEIADALAYSHREGVVHRDIKPENILLQEGHAVLADFGVARALTAAGGTTMTQAGFAVGTPAYMSPEQATASPVIDGKADIYALGCVLFEMLAGQPPFTGSNLQQVVAAHVTTPAPAIGSIRDDTPPALADLVTACLAKDPTARPSAAVVAERLKTTTSGVSAASRAGGRGRLIALTGAALALLAAGGWWALGRKATSSTSISGDASEIAVMPLSAISDSSLARLGQDLVVTLSTTLDGVGELHTVDAPTLLLNTRDAPSPLPLDRAREIATRLGAGSVLTGTLIHESGQVRAAVALYRVGEDTAIARASTLALAEDISALTDSLTWQVLRQVWRGGAPPSPVLAGLTTSSFEALRHFLDGERHFQQLDVDAAIAEYRRAFELDSNFVQAYLRYDAARTWSLENADSAAHARLLALAGRLPDRERLWLEATEQSGPLPERVARWQELIRRYPDYPPVLMSGVDGIVHSGPVYGIDLAGALPVLARLARLTPDNADVWMHKGAVEEALGKSAEAAQSFQRGATAAHGFFGELLATTAAISRSLATPGQPLPDDWGNAAVRAYADLPAGNRQLVLSGLLSFVDGRIPERLALVEKAQRDGRYQGEVLTSSRFGEGVLRIARGDWTGGVAALRQYEAANGSVSDRLSAARLATVGAWLGMVDPAVAAAAIGRVRAMPDVEQQATDRIELQWLAGLLAIVTGDAPAVERTSATLRKESNPVAAHAAASLRAEWLVKEGAEGAADSVQAVSDAMMREGKYLFVAEVVNRFVIARALRNRGQPAAVERYLMWTDAQVNTARTWSIRFALGPLAQFERGMALEEAGNHAGAVLQLSRFLATVDPSATGQQTMITEARRVVSEQVGADSAPKQGLAP